MGLKTLPLPVMVLLVLVAGCHPSGTTENNSTQKVGTGPNPGSAQGPVKPDNSASGSHAFVPFADKPPLGTPVETH